MVPILSYVFFDIETTGLPWEERNRTKIIELCFIAALRQDIENTSAGGIPPVSKITLLLNPQKEINPEATKLTGLTNDMLQYAPTFKEKKNTILSFLDELPKPVCLIAHNGNRFDFKILLTECINANLQLPTDLLCVDSLSGFQKLLKESNFDSRKTTSLNSSEIESDLLTDDEDEWPKMNVSREEYEEIDQLCSSILNTSINMEQQGQSLKQCQYSQSPYSLNKRTKRENYVLKTKNNLSINKNISFKLSDLYERLLNKKVNNAHRAEDDCLMLLECVIVKKDTFLLWADNNCKLLTEIKPLKYY